MGEDDCENMLTKEKLFKRLLDVEKEGAVEKVLAYPDQNKEVIALEKIVDQANRATSDVINALTENRQCL